MFIDIETTGLDPKGDSIVQLAYIYRVNGKLRGSGDFKGEGIYKRFVADLEKYVDRYNKEDKIQFIAYNAQFDSEFVRNMFLQNKNDFYGSYFWSPPICVMLLAAFKYMRKGKRPENFKLGTVCKDFKIKVKDESLHDAAYDILLTKQLYNKLLKW